MRLTVMFLLSLAVCEGQRITFDLAGYKPENKTSGVQTVIVNLTSGITEIGVNNIPSEVGFFIIQVHSYPYDIILSSVRKISRKTSVKGMNAGLLSFSHNETIFYVKAKNNTTALIAVTTYNGTDPIPGGCNLSFDTEYAPYQQVSYTEDVVVVKSQAPSAFDMTCDKNNITVSLYHMFLPEHNYDEIHYFDGIKNMLTVDSILSHGYKVSTDDGRLTYKKLYSAYRGVGQVFAIVATYQGQSSAYVPAVSYACDITNPDETCNGPITPHWKVLCALLLIFGLFINFFGHKLLRFTFFVIGFTIGIFVTYVILSVDDTDLSAAARTTTSTLFGAIYGSIWLFLWWKYGLPFFSSFLTFISSGYLMASIVFYGGPGDSTIFRNNWYFWLTFATIVSVVVLVSMIWTLAGHIFGCSFIGAFAFVTAMNYYIGGNLQYIVINSFRRMALRNFNLATIDPPFQILDGFQSVLLIILTCVGFYFQMKVQIGRAPYPPNYVVFDENTPLL